MGVKEFVALCERLAGRHGDRFKPAPLLVEMAKKGETLLLALCAAGREACGVNRHQCDIDPVIPKKRAITHIAIDTIAVYCAKVK